MPAAHADPSLLLCFDPRASLYHASDSHLSSVIHNDLPTDSDASEQPKMAQTPPMVTALEITAGGMSSATLATMRTRQSMAALMGSTAAGATAAANGCRAAVAAQTA